MKYVSTFLFVLLLLFNTSCSSEDPASPHNFEIKKATAKVVRDIPYGSDEAQTLDLYLPANRSAETTPVLVFIHGGGWVQGDKEDMNEYIPLLQKNHPEHAIANINYRLAELPERAAFPNQFLDLKEALEHLSEEADELQIKPEFGLIGVSAGGHLALQYDSEYDEEDQVKLVCSIVGPTDFTDPYYSENPEFELALELLIEESAYPGVTNYARVVSPAYLVNDKNSPTILFYGENDPLVPITNGTFLQERLNAESIANSFTIYEGGHGDWIDEDHADLQLQLSGFIRSHMGVD